MCWIGGAALIEALNVTLITYCFWFAAFVLTVLWPAFLLQLAYRRFVRPTIEARRQPSGPETSRVEERESSARQAPSTQDPRLAAIARRYNQAADV